jgi:predicted transcriptional regulator
MPRAPGDYLNPREQQIMEIAFRRGRVTAAELEAALPGRPSNSTVRTLLRILERRGHLTHVEEAGRFVYSPAAPRARAALTALDGVLHTFFGGSVEQAFATLLFRDETRLSPPELDRLAEMIRRARDARGD